MRRFTGPSAAGARASRSLDVQYYQIQRDSIGLQFLRELRDAARRGVRVRLLVDDLYTAGEDDLLAGLAAHPNVEVRLFNPLPSRAGSFARRLLWSLHEFGRVNHRMHNKLFIADNSFAVSGGRNLAAEYFMRSATANFVDLDVLSSGPVVRTLSGVFDAYWNSRHVRPVESVVARLPQDERRRRFERIVAPAGAGIPERPLDVLGASPVAQQLEAGQVAQAFASAQVFADTPDKVAGGAAEPGVRTVTEQTLALFALAREEVNMVSPYFIPGESGMAIVRAVGATDENGRLSLVTNSLGSTDEPLAYSRYAHYRLALLKAGVRIYELGGSLSRDSDRLGRFGTSTTRLHAKLAIIDRRRVLVGSMNLDPRSARLNTEIGLVIDSPELAQALRGLFRDSLGQGAYRLRLSVDGERVEWIETGADGRQTVHTREPNDGWLVRLKLWLLEPFVGEALL